MKKKQATKSTIIDKHLTDKTFRKEITTSSHYWFFHTYFHNYVHYPTAKFQRDFFEITEDNSNKLSVITAFRGSGKSTIMTLSFPIWAILGKQQRKFVVLLSQTQAQAKMHLQNLKAELESNELLQSDLGPFEERNEEWSSGSVVIPKYNARITAMSMEQSIRGIRHGAHRPDLIICDDVEDLSSVKTRDSRNKTYNWLTGDVIPCGDKSTRVVIVGNLLHEDSLLMRLTEDIQQKRLNGIVRSYPLINSKGKTLWKEKFPTKSDIKILQQTVGSIHAWHREYLLEIISDNERVIHPEWIQYYEDLPPVESEQFKFAVIGIDLAISQKASADYTAMVSCLVFRFDKKRHIYVLPHPVNKRMTFPQTIKRAKLQHNLSLRPRKTTLVVENVAYQGAMWQQLKSDGYKAEPFDIRGQDKRTRIALLSEFIRSGNILFPKKGAKALINQLVNFGVEKHDDLADAFVIAASYALEKKRKTFYCQLIC